MPIFITPPVCRDLPPCIGQGPCSQVSLLTFSSGRDWARGLTYPSQLSSPVLAPGRCSELLNGCTTMTISSVEAGFPRRLLWAHPGICCKFCSWPTATSGSSFCLKPNATGVHCYVPKSVSAFPAEGARLMFLSTSFTAKKKDCQATGLWLSILQAARLQDNPPLLRTCGTSKDRLPGGCPGGPSSSGSGEQSRIQSLRGSDLSYVSVTSQWRNLGLNLNLDCFHL